MPEVQFQYQLEHEGQTITYNVNPQHREKDNPNKSIWIVKPDVEYACFKFTYEKEWVVENEAWGFLLNEKKDLTIHSIVFMKRKWKSVHLLLTR